MKTNSIELISVTFGAGDSKLFSMSGNYFEIIDAPNPVDVILSAYTGEQRARMKDAAASFYSKGVEFGVIQITSATAQTIRFAYGSGETGTRRNTGSVTISGAVSLDAATLAALEQVNVRAEVATGFYSNNTKFSSAAQQIFSPSANTNGALILDAFADARITNPEPIALIAKSGAAPVSAVDGRVLAFGVQRLVGTYYDFTLTMHQQKLIPAGEGLYFFCSQTDSRANSFKACNYILQ